VVAQVQTTYLLVANPEVMVVRVVVLDFQQILRALVLLVKVMLAE
jgi:hypothetical protein